MSLSFIFINTNFLIGTYLLFSIGILALTIVIIRRVLRMLMKKSATFQMEVLMIRIPKEQQEDQDQQSHSLENIRERISVAEIFFATLGGMEAQKGWSAFWFGRNDHFALEIVADKDQLITFYAALPRYLRRYFEQQLHAQYETADVMVVEDYNIFEPQGAIVSSLLRLSKDQMFSLNTYDRMETDPLNALTNVLSRFEKEEGAAIQFMLRPAKSQWRRAPTKVARVMQQGKDLKHAYREVSANPLMKVAYFVGASFASRAKEKKPASDLQTPREYRLSPMEEEVVKMFEEKVSKSGFDVNIRVVVSSQNKELAELKCENILNTFTQFATYQYGNKFIASKPSENATLIEDFIYRHFDERHSFVLNTTEMASLWHLPLATTETPNIRWLLARRSPPPTNMPKEGIILGTVAYRGQETLVRMKREDRRRHVYIIGKSGSGKSVLLSSMAIQDIQNGEGVCVIDPHGDLVDDILPHIPRERAEDVVYFDPSDTERPIGLNMLEYDTNEQRDFAVQEMVAIFYKLFGQEMIGPMFEHYMRNAMLALMEDKEAGATLIEIPRMFTDADFRKEKLAKVKNLIVKNFWEQEYQQSQGGQQAADMLSYVISKIGRFLTNDMMRNIIGQAHSAFHLRDIMDNQRILLVNLSKGKLGEVNSSLLGLIMVSKIQMAAMARADTPREQRKDFYLYMDEFQNFATDSIATILSEARKYLLNLIMAHQYVNQMVVNNDTSIRDAVFGNAGTMIAFRVGIDDAEVLEKEFLPVFDKNDIMNVEQYTANIKLLIDNTASRPFNMRTSLPPQGDRATHANLKALSRAKYGHDRAVVEAEIQERGKLDQLGGGRSRGPDSFI